MMQTEALASFFICLHHFLPRSFLKGESKTLINTLEVNLNFERNCLIHIFSGYGPA